MLIFFAFFPMMISKIETPWPQKVKTIEGRKVCLEKENLYHMISTRTTDICMF